MPRHPHDPVAARLVDPRLTASLRRYPCPRVQADAVVRGLLLIRRAVTKLPLSDDGVTGDGGLS